MLHALLLAACLGFGIVPADLTARESVDVIEVNHFYDEQGRLVFDQAIFLDWSEAECRFNVRAWRLVKAASQLPLRDWDGAGYFAHWLDGEVLRRIHATAIRETWTQADPELAEREHLPKEKRRDLKPSLHSPHRR